ncbi:archease [Amycolatopsis taiwanensis]|uniref:Archease domain-containing protein n=1 Tax=Amycolatopsis taiwanensis TaxID=342230 RepID=A0A9W6QXE6_9PSEU|nr:archease [Amycolatopsis taiwanensis]GLY65493.1 putative protein archease [Amycolatopsis taiwanensis]
MTGSTSGHRSVAHTADLRVEAWAPTREECVAQAVGAMVESFADAGLPSPSRTVACKVTGSSDGDLLAAVLDEVIYRLETAGEIPVATEVSATPGGLRLRLHMVDADTVVEVGTVPKAVSLHELRCERRPDEWWCSAIVDV